MRRLALLVSVALAALAVAPAARAGVGQSPIPMFAYYYIWFNPSSWDRAKRDYPLLGRYSSDEERIMRTHVRGQSDEDADASVNVAHRRLPDRDHRRQAAPTNVSPPVQAVRPRIAQRV